MQIKQIFFVGKVIIFSGCIFYKYLGIYFITTYAYIFFFFIYKMADKNRHIFKIANVAIFWYKSYYFRSHHNVRKKLCRLRIHELINLIFAVSIIRNKYIKYNITNQNPTHIFYNLFNNYTIFWKGLSTAKI